MFDHIKPRYCNKFAIKDLKKKFRSSIEKKNRRNNIHETVVELTTENIIVIL